KRPAAGHPEPAGVVNDDQVDPAGLGALRADPGAGPAADDRFAGGDLAAQSLQTLLAGEKTHGCAELAGMGTSTGAAAGAGLRNRPRKISRPPVMSMPMVAMTSGVCHSTRSLSGL